MSLPDAAIKAFKPKAARHHVADGKGLCLLVCPDGSKSWTCRYRFAGKEKGVSFGASPAVSLLAAREKHKAALALIQEGKDPSAERNARKYAQKLAAVNSFEAVAREYLAKQANRWSARTASEHPRRLGVNVFRYIGDNPISAIRPRELIEVMERIGARGAHRLAHRVLQVRGQVFRYGVRTERCESDPVRPRNSLPDLAGAGSNPLPTKRWGEGIRAAPPAMN